ncbi:hypothetical protein [Mongoliibacter ruber]|uniref:Lipoprotein n=1 Tax=Mongoliibacter ruber TaxID=1750599 RepID=A0A2T0WS71_9BACT|nr:hypothetical protein [Mongoliibacter ruber]PRY89549.1 hypothetical protein CLW00_10224 [Mongoliibacter ruber]
MKTSKFLIIAISIVLLSSCAENVPMEASLEGKEYGFLWGFVHGLIAPIGLIVSFFDSEIAMYAPNNNGSWYALGFLLGSGGWGILASNSSKKNKS